MAKQVTFSRSKILDGSRSCYLGPGQNFMQYEKGARPDSSHPTLGYFGTRIVQGNPQVPGPQLCPQPNPQDWPSVGYVASPPNSVFLHIAMPMCAQTTNGNDYIPRVTHRSIGNPLVTPTGTFWKQDVTVTIPKLTYGYNLTNPDLLFQNYSEHGYMIGGQLMGTAAQCFYDGTYILGKFPFVLGTPDSAFQIMQDTTSTTAKSIKNSIFTNPWYAERLRLLDIANSVKSIIESSDHGRTFVTIVDEFTLLGQISGTQTGPPPYIGSQGYFNHDTHTHLLAPPSTLGGYRPNVMHIFIGSSTYDDIGVQGIFGFLSGASDIPTFNAVLPSLDPTAASFADTMARHVEAVPNFKAFPKFALKCYGSGVIGQHLDYSGVHYKDPSIRVSPPVVTFATDSGTQFVQWTTGNPTVGFPTFNLSYVYVYGAFESLSTNTASEFKRTGIDVFNRASDVFGTGGLQNQYLQDSCTYLTGHGIDAQYVGESNTITSASNLTQMIADHYGFDI